VFFFQCLQRVGEDDEDDVDGVNGDDGRKDEQKFPDLDRKMRRRREVSTKCSKKLAGFNLKNPFFNIYKTVQLFTTIQIKFVLTHKVLIKVI